jgi:hypothetical protein
MKVHKGQRVLKPHSVQIQPFLVLVPKPLKDLANAKKLYRPLQVQKDSIEQFLSIEYAICVDFYIDDVRLSDEFFVIPGLSEDAILGVNTFQKWRIKLDFEHDTVIVDPKVAKAMLK